MRYAPSHAECVFYFKNRVKRDNDWAGQPFQASADDRTGTGKTDELFWQLVTRQAAPEHLYAGGAIPSVLANKRDSLNVILLHLKCSTIIIISVKREFLYNFLIGKYVFCLKCVQHNCSPTHTPISRTGGADVFHALQFKQLLNFQLVLLILRFFQTSVNKHDKRCRTCRVECKFMA